MNANAIYKVTSEEKCEGHDFTLYEDGFLSIEDDRYQIDASLGHILLSPAAVRKLRDLLNRPEIAAQFN